MLLKMLPTQVSRYWEVILEGIKGGLPPDTFSSIAEENRLLKAITDGSMDVWLVVDTAAAKKVRALVVTTVVSDEVTRTRDLLLYCTFAFVPVRDEVWLEIDKDLVKVAHTNKCDRMVAYTKEDRVIKLMQACGYDTEYRFAYKELHNG
jgi:hypothetical protein